MFKLLLTSKVEIGRTSLVEGSTPEIVDGASDYGDDRNVKSGRRAEGP
jgi:hypothetical protein